MNLLCTIGLHRVLWMPVVTLTWSEDTSWMQVRRWVRCGRVIGRTPGA